MLSKKNILVLLLLFFVVGSHAQTTKVWYVSKFIDFRDSLNRPWYRNNTDNIGTMLMDGYLKGKLAGYSVEIGAQVLKRSSIPEERLPEKWTYGKYYYPGDVVSHQGVYYVTDEEPNPDISPEKTSGWRKTEVLGDPVSTRYYFPASSDIQPKHVFLKEMIQRYPYRYPPWDKDIEYVMMEQVEYQGRTYESVMDSKGKVPPLNRDHWQQTYNEIEFYNGRDFLGLRIVYAMEKGKLTPIMLTPLAENQDMGTLENVGISFYMNDVIEYFNQIENPVFYLSPFGYIGSTTWLLDEPVRINLLAELQKQLQAKKIKLNKKQILNQTLLSDFIQPTVFETLFPWNIYQDLTTNDIILAHKTTIDDFSHSQEAVLRIPASTLQKMLLTSKPTLQTPLQAVSADKFHFILDTLQADSLAPIALRAQETKPTTYSFLETYQARLDANNAVLKDATPKIWKAIADAFYQKKIEVKNPLRSLFPCEYNWASLQNEEDKWIASLDKNVLSLDKSLYIDSLVVPLEFKEISVTYLREIREGSPAISFSPFELGITMTFNQYGETSRAIYNLNWQKLKSILDLSDPAVSNWVNAIEHGKGTYYDSFVLYGLTGKFKK